MTPDTGDAQVELAGSASEEKRISSVEERAASAALALLPGAFVVYFSFQGGGYFAGSVGFATLVLLQILVVRVLFAARPFAGAGRRLTIAVALFATYTAWTLASALWSHAFARALVGFDRALLYLLLLVVFGLVPRHRWRMPWIVRGLAAGMLVICTISLITRLLPRVWPISLGVADNRLSYPLTYWNALGILASICIVLLLGLAANPRERSWGRALAAAGVPIAASTLLLTFSRGAIAALAIGVVVFVVIARSSALPGALLATIPTAGIALVFTYRATLLATVTPTTAAAVKQGHAVAIVVAIAATGAFVLRFALAPLDRWLANLRPGLGIGPGVWRGIGALIVAALLAVAVAAGGPTWVSRQYQAFLRSPPVTTRDLRQRLINPSSDNRIDNWRAALLGFDTAPLLGTGAGTYEFSWYRYRRLLGLQVVDAHNLYLQTLSELGIVGLLLLVSTLLALLVALGRRIRGPNRILYAALLSAALAWALHAALDWDWQMPAVTAWLFAAAGAALANRGSRRERAPMSMRARIPVAVALLVAAVIPALMMLSQTHLQKAASALVAGNCRRAEAEALASTSVLGVRPQPYEILGYCDISDRHPKEALAAMRQAEAQEPNSWEAHFGIAVAEAYAGMNPRSELTTALRLDPSDPLIVQLAPVLHTRSRARRTAIGRRVSTAAVSSGRLTLR